MPKRLEGPYGVRCSVCGRKLGLPEPGGRWYCHGLIYVAVPQDYSVVVTPAGVK